MSDSSEILAEMERDHVFQLAQEGERLDGRGLDEYRDVDIELGVAGKAEGSARVRLGDTDVLVGAKIETGDPFPDTPDQGVIITTCELASVASPEFEPGPPGEQATEIARVVDRGVRESGAVDLGELVIEEGESVWMAFIDIHVLDDGGNIMDAASLGAAAALAVAEVPEHEGQEAKPFPLDDLPVAATAAKLGEAMVFDPEYREEEVSEARLTTITTGEDRIAGMQKGLAGAMSRDQVDETVSESVEKAAELRKILKDALP